MSQQEKHVSFIGVSKIFSKDRKILLFAQWQQEWMFLAWFLGGRPLSACPFCLVCGCCVRPGRAAQGQERRASPVSPLHICFLKVFLGSGRVAFPEGVGEKLLLVSDWTNRMDLPSPFFSPKNNDRFPCENPL